MKRISLLLLFIGLFLNGQTFELEWSKTYGGSQMDEGYEVLKTPDGSFMVFGNTTSSDGDITDSPGTKSPWIIKIDSEGNLMWDKTLSHITNQNELDIRGKIIEIPGEGYLIAANKEWGESAYLFMVDYNIDLLWSRYLGTGSDMHGVHIIPTSDGGYLTGTLKVVPYNDLALIHKYDNEFNQEWYLSKKRAYFPLELPDGSFIFNRYRDSLDWDDDPSIIFKVSPYGNLQWQWGKENLTLLFDGIISSDGNLIYVGLSDLLPFGDPNSDLDYYIVKLSPQGEMIWEKTYGGSFGDWGRAIIEREEGGYIISGGIESLDGDVSNHYGAVDNWIIVLDENGDLQCEHSFGGSLIDDVDVIYTRTGIVPTPDGGYLLTSTSYSNDHDVPENKGYRDFWVYKININFEECGNMSVIDTNHQMEVSIYPNPVENGINVKAGDAKIQKIQLYDMTGRVILEEEVSSKSEFRFDLTRNVTKGNYILKVFTDKGARSFKILKNR